MCIAIPGKVESIKDNRLAVVDILGVKREISIDLTPHIQVGDYALVHAGFAIEVVNEEFAQETIDLIRQFPELIEDELPFESSAEDSPRETGPSPRPSFASLFSED